MADEPRIAVIGCGAITELFYLPALVRDPAVMANLILVDLNRPRAQALAAEFGVQAHAADHRAVLGEVDGAIVAVPTHLHHPIAMELLAQGVHALCEKPIALSASEARQMVQQAGESRVALAVNYTRRLYPSFAKVKEILAEGVLGAPLSIEYWIREEFNWPTLSGFYFSPSHAPRGVLLDRGVHVLDLICWWLGGKPHLVSSQNDSFGGPEALADVHLQHDRCEVKVSLSLLGKSSSGFRVRCERGTLEGDVYDFKGLRLTEASGRAKRLKLPGKESLYWDFGRRLVANFVDVVRGLAQPLVPGADTLDSMALIDECYAAANRFDMPWYDVLETAHAG